MSEFFLFRWISVVVLCCVKRVNLRLTKRSLHLSISGKNSLWGLEGLCDGWVRELCIFVCHTNHSVGCIKEQINLATFDILKFSLIVRLRGHKQKICINMVIQFSLCLLSLAAKLNFNISKVVYCLLENKLMFILM